MELGVPLSWLVRLFAQSSQELLRGHGGVSPWCHICCLWWLLQAAGSILSSPLHTSLWLQVTLALQRQSGTSNVTWAPLAADTMENHGDSA